MKDIIIFEVPCQIPDYYDLDFFKQLIKPLIFRGNEFAKVNNCIHLANAVNDEKLEDLFKLLKTYLYESSRVIAKHRDHDLAWDPEKHNDYLILSRQLKQIIKSKNYPSTVESAIFEII